MRKHWDNSLTVRGSELKYRVAGPEPWVGGCAGMALALVFVVVIMAALVYVLSG